MNNEIEWVVYDGKKHISLIVDLLKRNQYYLGKLISDLDEKMYCTLIHRRAFIFGVFAMYKGVAIAHIGAYMSGNQGIAKEKEVYLSTKIVDIKFRSVMPSIGDFYMRVMDEAINRGYRVAISDVLRTNFNSLYMIRRFGGMLKESEVNIYDNYLLYNYMAVIFETLGTKNIKETSEKYGNLFSATPPINKSKATVKDELVDDKYYKQSLRIFGNRYTFFINVHSQYVSKVLVDDYVDIAAVKDGNAFAIRAYEDMNAEVLFYDLSGNYKKEIYHFRKEETIEIEVSNEIEKIRFEFDDYEVPIQLFARKDYGKMEAVQDDIGNGFVLDTESGYLSYSKDEKKFFTEMWPCFTRPMLSGYLEPRRFGPTIEKKDEREFILFENGENYQIRREYSVEKKSVIIHTYVDVKKECIKEPVFHIALDSLDYECTIITEKEQVIKTFSKKDKGFCNEEMLYEYFGKEEYTQNIFKEVLIDFKDMKIRITSNQNMYCFHQFNYIGFRFVKQEEVYNEIKAYEKEQFDFGSIKIEILE